MIKERIKKADRNDFLIVVLVGVLILIIAIPTGGKQDKGADEQDKNAYEDENVQKGIDDELDYEKNCEERLKNILEKMNGVGKAEVMITFSNNGRKEIDKDIKESTECVEKNTVIYERDDDTTPYVLSQSVPGIEGVLVVAEGGGDPGIDSEISDAVLALFDVEAHKIKIVKMSEREDN